MPTAEAGAAAGEAAEVVEAEVGAVAEDIAAGAAVEGIAAGAAGGVDTGAHVRLMGEEAGAAETVRRHSAAIVADRARTWEHRRRPRVLPAQRCAREAPAVIGLAAEEAGLRSAAAEANDLEVRAPAM